VAFCVWRAECLPAIPHKLWRVLRGAAKKHHKLWLTFTSPPLSSGQRLTIAFREGFYATGRGEATHLPIRNVLIGDAPVDAGKRPVGFQSCRSRCCLICGVRGVPMC
jgi:hypothetical protein